MSRIVLSNHTLRQAIERQGWPEPKPGLLHLFGIRGAHRVAFNAVETNENTLDLYNDTLGVFGRDFALWEGSTDPGAYFTKNVLNINGAAHLVSGCWQYRRGLHRGKPALVQAEPVTVRRDSDRDGRPEYGEPLDTGWFGINVHAGGIDKRIGKNSAGCQVLRGGWSGEPWLQLMRMVESADQRTYSYYLFEVRHLL